MAVEKKRPNGTMTKVIIGAVIGVLSLFVALLAIQQNNISAYEKKIDTRVKEYAFPNVEGCILKTQLNNMDEKLDDITAMVRDLQ